MKLTYRGITYDRNSSEVVARPPFPSLRPSNVAYDLIYRGITYRVDPSAKQTKVSVQSATNKLIYRGATI
jgi:Domain of unknown function (DUF4278)